MELRKINTLHFVLNKPRKLDGGMSYTYDEIMEEIWKQTCRFEEKMGVYPRYINMELKLYSHLQKLVNELCTVKASEPERVYGMIIKIRDKDIVKALSDREIVCVGE